MTPWQPPADEAQAARRGGPPAAGAARPARRARVAVAAVFCAVALLATPAAERAPRVAAASDLSAALTEVAAAFQHETGLAVDLVFGSSGTLTRQIRDGAPFDLFLSADEAFIEQLARAGLTRDDGVLYAVGRLALFAPTGSPLRPGEGLDGLARLVARGEVRRFAIANPTHAPYGRAAEAALKAHGIWSALESRLVRGENVSQAAQFATAGDAAGGLIAYSLALTPALRARGTFALVPDTDHPPLRQRMVRLARAGEIADRFYRYLQGPAARATLERHGFSLPR